MPEYKSYALEKRVKVLEEKVASLQQALGIPP